MSWFEALPLIGSMGNSVAQLGNSRKDRQATKEMNERNIQFQTELNNTNRQWSEDMWNKTNAYNSPQQLMERYKQAGLNPHLIYGSQPQASQPMSASTSAPHVEKMPIKRGAQDIAQGLFQGAQSYIALKQQQTQTDNLEKARQVMDADILAKNASTAESMTRNAKSKFDLDLAQDLRSNVVEQSILNTKNIGLTSQKLETDIRATNKGMEMTDAQISKIAQDIVVQKKQIELMSIQGQNAKADLLTKELDRKLKSLDLNLKELGLQPTDSPLWRVPVQLYNKFEKSIKDYGRDKFPAEKLHIPKSWK